MKKIAVLGIIIVVLLIVSGIVFYQNQNNLNSVRINLYSVQSELKASQDNISIQNILIDNLSQEVIDLQSQVDAKDKEISEASNNLALTENQLSQYKDGYNNTKTQFDSISQEIEKYHEKSWLHPLH